jgi:hypothetical protein
MSVLYTRAPRLFADLAIPDADVCCVRYAVGNDCYLAQCGRRPKSTLSGRPSVSILHLSDEGPWWVRRSTSTQEVYYSFTYAALKVTLQPATSK